MAKTKTSGKRSKKAVSDEFIDDDNVIAEGRTEIDSSGKSIADEEEDAPTERTHKQEEKDHDEQAKNARSLLLKNVPYRATKEDILKTFRKATSVRFPGETQRPSKGIAFVEFKNPTIAMKERQKKQGVMIQGRSLVVEAVGDAKATISSRVTKANSDNSTKVPSKTLMVRGLAKNTTSETLRQAFERAVKARVAVDKDTGVSRRFGFVEFETNSSCSDAKEYMEDCVIDGSKVILDYAKVSSQRARQGATEGLVGCPAGWKAGEGHCGRQSRAPSKILMVRNLTENTTLKTLKRAFKGAVRARVALDKDTGASKRFGFVAFTSEDICKAAKEAMKDCVIDGNKVILEYAKAKTC